MALRLVQRYGPQVMATARRYAASPEDAEDAYQRGLEILLTKAPSTRESDLLPWLRTVVKHEAFTLRRQRERHGQPVEAPELEPGAGQAPEPQEQAERLERLQLGAEALAALKPAEVRCLVLLAEGYSYKQIAEATGFSYTKVNRSIAEGRRGFVARLARIESGEECKSLAPLLSAVVDGEATPEQVVALRRHLRSCLACRAALREARETPGRAAALVPAGVVGALRLPHHGGAGALVHGLHSVGGWIHERASAVVLRAHEALELTSAHKVAALAATSAAVAGGGAAASGVLDRHEAPRARHSAVQIERATQRVALSAAAAPRRPAAASPPPRRGGRGGGHRGRDGHGGSAGLALVRPRSDAAGGATAPPERPVAGGGRASAAQPRRASSRSAGFAPSSAATGASSSGSAAPRDASAGHGETGEFGP